MALPQLNTPTYELEVPSTGVKISYRPFLIKEQKVLMIAQEQGGERALLKAVGNIIKDCTMGTIENPEDLPTFDMEYLFLKIRGKSVGDKVELNLLCPDDEKTRVLTEIDLNEIKIEKGESTNTIQLSDEIGITMKYPTVKDLINFGNEKSTVKMTFDIVQSCTVNIFDANDVYEDFSRKELQDFFEQLNTEQFDKIQKFFDEMPKLKHTVKVKNPNTGVESDIVLEGLQSFLG
tara:strand:- start:303 stop:1004 length:702 start_codon:yes stop_codon:yes gene_type:complete